MKQYNAIKRTQRGKCIHCRMYYAIHAGFCSEECAREFNLKASNYVILKPSDSRRKVRR